MMTPEAKVKLATKKLLATYRCYSHWPVVNGLGTPTLDCIGCYRGYFFAIETKAPGKKPTPRQEVTMAAMREAGAQVFVVDGSPDSIALLKEHMDTIQCT